MFKLRIYEILEERRLTHFMCYEIITILFSKIFTVVRDMSAYSIIIRLAVNYLNDGAQTLSNKLK